MLYEEMESFIRLKKEDVLIASIAHNWIELNPDFTHSFQPKCKLKLWKSQKIHIQNELTG